MKVVAVPSIACIKAIASILLLSSCGGGGGSPAIGALADDDCTATINVSTTLQTEVDINGNVSTVPVANNTVSGCETSSATGDALPTSLVTTRFENTEDFDVWDCIRTDGSSLQYALLPRDDFPQLGLMLYAFEIDPDAEDLVASQQLYSWRAPLSANADTITLSTRERVGRYGEGSIESQWTGIALATTDNMNFISSTEGAMQCNKTVSVVDLAASRFDIPCEYRGPVSAC